MTRAHRSRAAAMGIAVATLSITLSLLPTPAGAEIESQGKFGLRTGDSFFVRGPWVEDVRYDGLPWPASIAEAWANYLTGKEVCAEDFPCWSYKIEVLEKADRLRVAIDFPLQPDYDYFGLDLYDDNGTWIGYGGGYVSQEIIVENPDPGTYEALVIPWYAVETTFRVRAKLDNEASGNSRKRLLAPNLRVEPPYHFTFQSDSWPAPDSDYDPPCYADETVEDGARRCLRLTVGAQNVGDGPLELKYSSPLDPQTPPTMYQRLNYSDGTTKMRQAGTYEYHKTHGHYHFLGFSKLDLWRVTDPQTGSLRPAGKGHKVGFCLGDIQIAQWHRFVQAPAYSAQSDCDNPSQAWMGLSTGWTDLYSWGTPGNFVDFGDNPDGYYVVRAEVDAAGGIRETNETDNAGYAYIEVRGDSVRIIERGRGSDPWDPHKRVIVDWWR